MPIMCVCWGGGDISCYNFVVIYSILAVSGEENQKFALDQYI